MAALRSLTVLVYILAAIPACESTRIALRETVFGSAKREQLVDRVQEARDAQNDAKEQFASALDEFLALTGAQGSKLEDTYKRLRSQSESAAARADAVRTRIGKVESVAGALFKEWEAELDQYRTPTLRQSSERMLRDTQGQYERLIGAMKKAEGKMQPVLDAFNDQVLFLKHNLNAQAVASLQGTAGQVESDVSALIRELEASIAEANAFIEQMGKQG